jgi:ABC-type dipeptide/oligopeptide/nickel transport system permease subunit
MNRQATPDTVRLGLPLAVLSAYILIACGVWAGWWGTGWAEINSTMWLSPSADHWLGTNRLGQDILQRAIAATATAFEVGLVVAVSSTVLGVILGVVAGYFSHRWVDELILWITGTLDAIPFYLLVGAIAFALRGHAWAMHLAMIVAFWTMTGRLVRAETMRLSQASFVEAARVGGLTPTRIIARHIIPHLTHLVLVQFTLIFVAAIKTEVILSFLGIGVQDSISWGVMIAEAGQDVLAGQYMNFIVASTFLFGLIMSINLLADRVQDLLDPRFSTLQRRPELSSKIA